MKAFSRSETFLLVDDDAVSIMAMKRALKSLGITNDTHVARDGIEAVEFLKEVVEATGKQPHIIVTLDYNMPRMNGPEFVKAIRSHPALKDLPVLMFLSSDHRYHTGEDGRHDVSGYLCKDNLVATLKDALETRLGQDA